MKELLSTFYGLLAKLQGPSSILAKPMHKSALFLFNLLVDGGAGGGGVLLWSLAALPELNSLNKSCRCKELPKYV